MHYFLFNMFFSMYNNTTEKVTHRLFFSIIPKQRYASLRVICRCFELDFLNNSQIELCQSSLLTCPRHFFLFLLRNQNTGPPGPTQTQTHTRQVLQTQKQTVDRCSLSPSRLLCVLHISFNNRRLSALLLAPDIDSSRVVDNTSKVIDNTYHTERMDMSWG